MTPDWRDRAACLEVDPELFFPVGEAHTAEQVAEAVAVCMPCPVRADCLRYALTATHAGIWGGKTEAERVQIQRRRRRRESR